MPCEQIKTAMLELDDTVLSDEHAADECVHWAGERLLQTVVSRLCCIAI